MIPRLRALLHQHPLRQRAWAHLMTALYRIGDVAGALAAYRQVRQVLADETGMDPGPELTRLHEDILHHRPLDDAAETATDATAERISSRAPAGFVQVGQMNQEAIRTARPTKKSAMTKWTIWGW